MHPMRLRRTITAFVLLAVAAAIPAATSAQAPYRAACDLLSDDAVSEVLGVEATAQRQGTRQMCNYIDADGNAVGLIWLHSREDLSLFAMQEGSEPVTIAGVEGITFPIGGQGRVILALPDGGLLDVTASPPGTDPEQQQPLATSLAEAILATGPVTAVPADRGEVEALYVVTTLCDALTVEQVNEIMGGSYTPPDGTEEERCFYPETEGFGGITTGLFEDGSDTIDAGTYESEELTVAGRPATWQPQFGFLDVDAGAGRTLHVNAAVFDEVEPALRDQLVAIVEAIIPSLTTAVPPTPPPAAGCDAPLDELSRITGLELTTATPFAPLCFYVGPGGAETGVLVGFLPGDDPASALEAADFTSDVEPTPGDVDGRPALITESPEGMAIAVDLDGLPNGDGLVLLVAVGGLAAGSDALAVTTEVVRFLISRM
jgi:hypothetical protein